MNTTSQIKNISDKPKLLDQVRDTLRTLHYSRKTEEAYTNWIKQFIIFNNRQHPDELDNTHVSRFLTHLAVNRHVSSSTQNQALCAIVFLYKRVLQKNFGWLEDLVRAKKSLRMPVVFTKTEALQVIENLNGTVQLAVSILYGGGLRLNECLELRIKDIDFEYKTITVRDSKGEKDRTTVLPNKLLSPLKKHLSELKILHESDLKKGKGYTILPNALAKKYINAGKELGLAT